MTRDTIPGDVVTLEDPAAGTTAAILPRAGFNCFRFTAWAHNAPHEVLWTADDFGFGGRPSASGNPILFPFAGRLRGTHVKLGGREYSLSAGDALGNAIHGFVLDRPWRVVERSAQAATGRFTSRDFPELAKAWPSQWELDCRYEIAGNELRSALVVRNNGDERLPFSLGTHPYFCVPLGPRGREEMCRLQVPAAKYWELDAMLATGRLLSADGPRGLAAGMKLSQTRLDDMFTELHAPSGQWTASIDDDANRVRLEVSADWPLFRECVVYNPPHRRAVCIEPYTAVPNAPELAERGIETGWRTLEPGESLTGRIDIRLAVHSA